MFEVIHSPSGRSWSFSCMGIPVIQGGGRDRVASFEAAEHAVRQYLSREQGPVSLREARTLTHHRCDA